MSVDLGTELALQFALRSSKTLQRKGSLQSALVAIEQVKSEAETAAFPVAWLVVKRVATLCNRLATKGPVDGAMDYLHRAEGVLTMYIQRLHEGKTEIPKSVFQLQILTWNNIATWHKQRTNFHMALQYLMNAYKLCESCSHLKDSSSLHSKAQTRLNMSAMYSEMGKHKSAIKHAEDCLVLLQQEMTLRSAVRNPAKTSQKDKFEAMIVSFVVAFYNIGVGEEALRHQTEALEAYKNAVSIGTKHLLNGNPALNLAKQALSELTVAVDSLGLSPKPLQIISQLPSPEESPKTDSGKEKKANLRLKGRSSTAPKPILRMSRAGSQRTIFPKNPDSTHKKSANSVLNLHSDSQNREEDKYYSKAELEKLKKKMEAGSRLKFVSSDQYFMSKITKTLNVTRDIQHLRPLSGTNAMDAWDKDEEEKRRVSALRLKRHPQTGKNWSKHGLEIAQKLINRLKEEDDLISKRNSVTIKSRMKTKAYKRALLELQRQSIAMASPYPPQRLFFRSHGDGSPDRSAPLVDHFEPLLSEVQPHQTAHAKEEIEKMMDDIATDLKGMTETQGQMFRPRTSSEGTGGRYCELAKSTARLNSHKTIVSQRQAHTVTRDSVDSLTSLIDRKKAALYSKPTASTYRSPVQYPY